MKKLELNQMEMLEGGKRWYFSGTMGCYLGLASLGIGVAGIFSGIGTAAGVALLLDIAGTMPECFDYR
ncbi:MAG: hypothetical protein O9282_12400 [Flavobacterium sp.]|jgi:hypothetical protein|uniref:hypothetical protein n=1 Tax=Flavobacterium sp. TaxID=239 RepID=UPI0022C86838|nr:hypothetical protein [Flavobacterium sp.]MCZ8332104.1 hypothetical protein [Flavobacterium sp.]